MISTRSKCEWEVDNTKCIGCGDCVAICPVKALRMKKGVPFMADIGSCCGESCRICEYHCQAGAIMAY